ncbi:hypothetical protein CFI00_08175 [Nocardioides sp. S5]|uniref:hypothetical protein n=1 Tax=Nocardioides sp. S5 TaxID=2017486 RepID=UPI001A8F16D0|nr:hypothetical protein [Nocardioides sp. S5]QSR30481.1 hypothetical protein CFI00_08175 [Nocardioides sp. S5]
MAARATTNATARSRTGQRLRRWIGLDYEEDGVFRPVRLSLAVDLGISVGIVVLVVGSFAGFIAWLASTQ